MGPIKIHRIEIFMSMSRWDKVLTVSSALAGIVLFANGLYLVGRNGLLLVVGTLMFLFIARIFRDATIKIITEGLEKEKSTISSGAQAVGAAANTNNDLIPSILEKRQQNRQQGLLSSIVDNMATPERDEEQARADHEFLVEMARKKQEAMRTAIPGPSVDPSVKKKIIEQQEAYVKELMKPTIIPQRELAEKDAKKDKN